MKLDFEKEFDVKKGRTRLEYLISKKAKADLTEKFPARTLNQNAYEHVLFDLFGIEFGYSRKDVKQNIFKKIVNDEMFRTAFVDKQTGEVFEDWRSTADLTTKENTLAIERFRNYSAQNGLYLQTSQEYLDNKFYIDREIERNKEYL
jgi:hypothetical protein